MFAFSVSGSVFCKLPQVWLILILNFKVENFLILCEVNISYFTVYIFIYFNQLCITDLQHTKFRGQPSWTSSLTLRCKSISFFVWSGYESYEKTGLLSVCFLNSILLLVNEFSGLTGLFWPHSPSWSRTIWGYDLSTAVCFIDYWLTALELVASICPLQSESLLQL